MKTTGKWDIFELEMSGPADGNPFIEVELTADFTFGHRSITVDGFYDGDGVYRVRFMPDREGEWKFVTHSNDESLDGESGSFICEPAAEGVHGPVRVHRTRFAYEDGAAYQPVGTTCYVWNHQGDDLEEKTLLTLEDAPFNKMRMCVFPKHYAFNLNEPEYYPFAGTPDNGSGTPEWDYARFSPEFFRHLELRVSELRDLDIEADLIIFHPYDRWGFATMTAEADDRYLRYLVARLAAFRNVWWSFANEFDLMDAKRQTDWDRFFQIVQQYDPYQHLRSIHNCRGFYDHGKPWVTHCSVQHHELNKMSEWIDLYKKPVVVDECGYEGDIPHDWGNLTAKELVNRFWIGFALGGYVGHGETYVHPEDILWWSKGGELHGESPARIEFLKRVMYQAPEEGYTLLPRNVDPPESDHYLVYHADRQPRYKIYRLPENRRYRADIIDAWDMKITEVPGTHSGEVRIDLPGKPMIAVRFTAV